MTVSTRIDNKIGWVTIDNPPINSTSQTVRAGLLSAVSKMDEAGVQVVILSCAGQTFVTGADVKEFTKAPIAPHFPDVLTKIEEARAPWIAAIHGFALGGGLELALACSYRIADVKAKLGLPEVTLGLIPGAGGTVRLPRLIAPEKALEMVTGGKHISATRAADIGLVDVITKEALDQASLSLAKKISSENKPIPLSKKSPRKLDNPSAWKEAISNVKSRSRGQNSIVAAADALDRSLTLTGKKALMTERKSFLSLKDDPQSLALRHIFFAERGVGKSARTDGQTAAKVTRIGVIGGGTMGSGISAACLMNGLRVTMIERSTKAAATAATHVDEIMSGAKDRGKMTDKTKAEAMKRFEAKTEFSALSDADLVIEAVFEDMDVKREVFDRLDQVTRPDAILASNTSYLDVAVIAKNSKYPDRVIGLHFFSPAHIMKLLEVIIPKSASGQAVATGLSMGKRLRKISVPAGVCDGFIGNRIMSAYRLEAEYMIEEGALPLDVDSAMRSFGFQIGIFQMQDLAGLDIAWAMRQRKAKTRPTSERYVEIADRLCEIGRFGLKTGKGWYDYSDDPRGAVDPEVTKIIENERAVKGIKRVSMSEDEIMSRILNVMQVEGQMVLEEGIAATSEAIDVVMVNGYGFPRWRGGPMFIATKSKEKNLINL